MLKNPDLIYWIVGIKWITICIIMSGYYYLPISAKTEIQNSLDWELLYRIIIIMLFAFAVLYLSTPISKIIAKQPRIMKWYEKYARQSK